MPASPTTPDLTPFEFGNGNQTTTPEQCNAFYADLQARFPGVLHVFTFGTSDGGFPLLAGIVSADGEFDRERLKRQARPVFFNNNGIHPGEPEGIDACMALVRDFCVDPQRRAALGRTVFLFVAVYNVDGHRMRQNTARVNQLGPELFGFRANSRNLDLNRDFVKCDSLEAQAFNRLYSAWDPDVMVDTHTSNGADYAYTMTLIHTQTDKLGEGLGGFMRDTMLPEIYRQMEQRGWPTCPYVEPIGDSPDTGIEHMLDVPRFSTGYAALHHTIGFMPETHMLKPFADRYAATRALVDTVLEFTVRHGARIQLLRQEAKRLAESRTPCPVAWKIDRERPSRFSFRGYKAVYAPSKLGNYQRMAYDRKQPWEREIDVFDRCSVEQAVARPRYYVFAQAYQEVAQRLSWNGVRLERVESDQRLLVRVYRIASVGSRVTPYEGRCFHDTVRLTEHEESFDLRAGDFRVPLEQEAARYAIETLEPLAHDSFFRWGFFNAVLEKKEKFSNYVFEDTAQQMLADEPALRELFEAWKSQHPELAADQRAVLGFLFLHGLRYREPQWMRYPVAAVM
ncbi:MAG: M14 family zinc carboxypeptidase [Betaproteobacteria bacterium]